MARIERGDAFEDFDEEDTREEAEGEGDDSVLPPDGFLDYDDWGDYDLAYDWDGGDADAYPGSFAIVASVTLL